MQMGLHKKMKNKANEVANNKHISNKLSFRPAQIIKMDLRAK